MHKQAEACKVVGMAPERPGGRRGFCLDRKCFLGIGAVIEYGKWAE